MKRKPNYQFSFIDVAAARHFFLLQFGPPSRETEREREKRSRNAVELSYKTQFTLPSWPSFKQSSFNLMSKCKYIRLASARMLHDCRGDEQDERSRACNFFHSLPKKSYIQDMFLHSIGIMFVSRLLCSASFLSAIHFNCLSNSRLKADLVNLFMIFWAI